MEKQEEKFKTLISEIEKIILIKAPSVKRRALILENSEFFDIPEFTKNNEELDLLGKRYTELCVKALGIDKKIATKEIKNIIKNKKMLDKNYSIDIPKGICGPGRMCSID